MDQKIENLIAYCQGLYQKEDGKTLYLKYLKEIQSITPQELVIVQYEQLKMGYTPRQLLEVVDKLMNVFHQSLSQFQWQRPEQNSFLHDMMAENAGLVDYLNKFKEKIKANSLEDILPELKAFIEDTKAYNAHLLKIENILFPYLEKKADYFNGFKIMWSRHDELREMWKDFGRQVEAAQNNVNTKDLHIKLGKFFFILYGLVQKQELVLFPTAATKIEADEFQSMRQQSLEYEFAFIEPPEIIVVKTAKGGYRVSSTLPQSNYAGLKHFFQSETGQMDFEQLHLLLDALPIDMTLVDENDKVAYFSRPKDRIFQRSIAVIGRNVRNCHPPESVHIVEEIIAAFRRDEQDEADFWIQMKDLFIYIQYFALRNDKGQYRGTLEVTQEISKLRKLDGERRLLEWRRR